MSTATKNPIYFMAFQGTVVYHSKTLIDPDLIGPARIRASLEYAARDLLDTVATGRYDNLPAEGRDSLDELVALAKDILDGGALHAYIIDQMMTTIDPMKEGAEL